MAATGLNGERRGRSRAVPSERRPSPRSALVPVTSNLTRQQRRRKSSAPKRKTAPLGVRGRRPARLPIGAEPHDLHTGNLRAAQTRRSETENGSAMNAEPSQNTPSGAQDQTDPRETRNRKRRRTR